MNNIKEKHTKTIKKKKQKKKGTLNYEEVCILGNDDTRCSRPAEL